MKRLRSWLPLLAVGLASCATKGELAAVRADLAQSARKGEERDAQIATDLLWTAGRAALAATRFEVRVLDAPGIAAAREFFCAQPPTEKKTEVKTDEQFEQLLFGKDRKRLLLPLSVRDGRFVVAAEPQDTGSIELFPFNADLVWRQSDPAASAPPLELDCALQVARHSTEPYLRWRLTPCVVEHRAAFAFELQLIGGPPIAHGHLFPVPTHP